MMEKLLEEVTQSVTNEYVRAGEQYGFLFNSNHEAYAVTLEELQETQDEIKRCSSALDKVWAMVKDDSYSDEDKLTSLKLVQTNAMLAACEAIQVAAMAVKSMFTIEGRRGS